MDVIASFHNVTVTIATNESITTTEDTFLDEVAQYTEFKVATAIADYWFPIIVPIGFIGNSLSFIVMMRGNNRRISTCIYMAAISVNDNIMMYLCLHVWLVAALFFLFLATRLLFGLLYNIWHCGIYYFNLQRYILTTFLIQ